MTCSLPCRHVRNRCFHFLESCSHVCCPPRAIPQLRYHGAALLRTTRLHHRFQTALMQAPWKLLPNATHAKIDHCPKASCETHRSSRYVHGILDIGPAIRSQGQPRFSASRMALPTGSRVSNVAQSAVVDEAVNGPYSLCSTRLAEWSHCVARSIQSSPKMVY